MDVKSLKVYLQFGSSKILVGALEKLKNQVYFRFDSEFLSRDIEISPFKLKSSTEIKSCPKEPFEGLFGVFNDSLPDGWGRLLMDRKLIEKGFNPSEIGPLDRLALLGENTQGALVYEPSLEQDQIRLDPIDLDKIALESLKVLETDEDGFLDQLYKLGGNSVGARPKVAVYYNESLNSFSVDSKPNHEAWIVKFPSLYDLKDIAKIEFAYYKMAIDAGIIMAPSRLLNGKQEKTYFGTKRFDRLGSNRLHYHSACGLLHDNFRASTIDYGHVMDAANRLERNFTTCSQVFRIAVFNVYAGNMDDHSKNIGFLMDEKGQWKLAPAFDLTFSPKAGNFHSLAVSGSYKDIGKDQLLKLAQHFSIKDAQQIIHEVKEVLSTWKTRASEYQINKKEAKLVFDFLDKKLSNKKQSHD